MNLLLAIPIIAVLLAVSFLLGRLPVTILRKLATGLVYVFYGLGILPILLFLVGLVVYFGMGPAYR
jgi:hypothetical protein